MTEETRKLTNKQRLFIDYYLQSFNASDAARKAGYSERTAHAMGWENLRKPEVMDEIRARLDEVHMSADEALKHMADMGRSDMGVFWKVTDEWMYNPLPEYEILDEKEVIDDTKDPPEKRISYRVRHVVLDMDKVADPRYSWMIKKFSNSRRNGLSIEMYDRHAVNRDILKVHGKFTDRVDVTTGGEKVNRIEIVYADIPTETTPGADTDQE